MTELTPDILQQHEFPQVRSLLGVDSDNITDADILALPVLYLVEASVKEVITDWATLVTAASADYIRLKSGVMYWVAALLCDKLMKSEAKSVKIGDYSETGGDEVDWKDKAADLVRKAAGILASVSTRTALTRPTAMVLAGPTRSEAGVPSELEEWIERIQPRFLDGVEEGYDEDDSYYGI